MEEEGRLDNSPTDSGSVPSIVCVERTLALIKPDVVDRASEIEDIILRSGFTILQRRRVHLTPEQASDFYAEHFGKLFFPSLMAYMSNGPIVALTLAKQDAVSCWRELIGPTNSIKARETHPGSLRALYGTDGQRNGFHGSDSKLSAEREVRFFFPESVVEPISEAQSARDYMTKTINPTLLKALTELCKQKPFEPVTWLSEWLLSNNPYKPKVKPTSMIVDESED